MWSFITKQSLTEVKFWEVSQAHLKRQRGRCKREGERLLGKKKGEGENRVHFLFYYGFSLICSFSLKYSLSIPSPTWHHKCTGRE